MNKQQFCNILMALVAMSFLETSFAQQTRAFTPKIKTPDTKKDLAPEDRKTNTTTPSIEDENDEVTPKNQNKYNPQLNAGAPRKLQQHGLGLGLGQTLLFGNYSKHGTDKITLDLLYSYAASYSFDLLVNAHMSEHEDEKERIKIMGLTSSIKGRFIEYDNLSPYFLGGLGFYAPRAKRLINNENKWTAQKLTFGMNFGGGVDLRLNDNYVVGILAQVHWPFKMQQEDQPDLKGYYMKFLITGMYLF